MKIVFLAPFGLRPKGTVLARMVPIAVELKALGHEVVVIAPPYTNPDDAGKTEIVAGVPVKNITLGPGNKVLAAPCLAWRMFRAALAERPDLVHLFKPKGYAGLAAMLQISCKKLGIDMPPLFLDTDDWEGKGGMNEIQRYSSAERTLFAFQEQWLPRQVLGVTVASRELEVIHLGMGIGPQRLLYLPNCVEERPLGDRLLAKKKLGIPVETPLLLLYTRFFEFNQEKLHQVLAMIHQRLPHARFLVVGKGRNQEEEQLRAAAREKGFVGSLEITGWVEPAELPGYLAASDVALYPFDDNLVNRAKCPAKLTELLSSGVPVVADRVGQIPGYFAPELQFLLSAPDDWEQLANNCVDLLLDRPRQEKISTMGRAFILRNFRWDVYAELLHKFYADCIASGKH